MGRYIDKGNEAFRNARTAEYIDKTEVITFMNSVLNTERRYSCITRCRRFGKSMAAKMLCAYYDKSCDSRDLFAGLKAANDSAFETNLNKYPVIYLDVTNFTTIYRNDPTIVKHIQEDLKKELLEVYPDTNIDPGKDLMSVITAISYKQKQKFIMIVDEWDAILREFDKQKETIDNYIDLFRSLFKGSDSDYVFAGVYITGILPIKKYKTESALNNFREYSMVQPGKLAGALGFTKKEVQELCEKYDMDFEKMQMWYDGYKIGKEPSMFNPYSVMEAIANEDYANYWANTGAYDNLRTYIQMNYDGLKDDIINMLSGGRCYVNPSKFQNDMSEVRSKDEVFTVLIHLGYLAYDAENEVCYIPNKEVAGEFNNAVEDSSWSNIAKTIQDSRELLDATLNGNETAVAKAIDLAHDENTSILAYNNENSLACVLSIAYIWAKNKYIIHRELATGKGYADLVMIPRKDVDLPALVVELKYNKDTETAIDQIKKKNYPAKIAEYVGNLLLVGINYDKETKLHTCKIEKYLSDGLENMHE